MKNKKENSINLLKDRLEKEEVFVCPNCNSLSSKCRPFYRNIFDGAAVGYFIDCNKCSKSTYLQILY